MKFYYNSSLNICAERTWVIDFLVLDGKLKKEYCNDKNYEDWIIKCYAWHECAVSGTIEEAMNERK